MTNRATIRTRWDAYRCISFPRNSADLDPNGICLASTDTYAAGCITSYLSGPLPEEKRRILQKCAGDLNCALEADTLSAEVRSYFSELRDIANGVLEATE